MADSGLSNQTSTLFEHHPPQTEQEKLDHAKVREQLKRTALSLASLVPQSRELSLAFTKLEEAMFWANAGLARSRHEREMKKQKNKENQ